MNANDFLKAALDSGIIPPDFLSSYAADSAAAEDVDSLSCRLVETGKLTAFQADHIRDGKADELVIGPYLLLEVLGKGGMGTVYRAEHRKMRRVVALKVITETALKNPDATRRFEREAEAAARLDHPNIVTAYDAGEAADTHYLVMQLVNGKSLSEIVKESGPQPPERVAAWMLQAAHGLAYAHGRGVVHRDIKPGNLLLDQDGTVKILDMGLARLESRGGDRDQLTGTGQVMGTIDFMAPEQAVETRRADARSDIYSLGATLWYLITGGPMFAGDSVVQKIMAHQQQQRPRLSGTVAGIDSRLEAAFQMMVATAPEARFQSMQEVITALENVPHAASRRVNRRDGPGTSSAADASPRSSPALVLEPTTRLGRHGSDETAAGIAPATGNGPHAIRSTWWTPTRRTGAAAAVLAVTGTIVFGARLLAPAHSPSRDSSASASRPREAAQPPHAAGATATQPPTSGEASRDAPAPAVVPFAADRARPHQEAWAKHLGIPVEFTNSIGATLVLIPPGRFTMGPPGAFTKGEGHEYVRVVLTKPFLIGQNEVTQAEWRLVMGTQPWKGKPVGDGRTYSSQGEDVAATHISWEDAVEYCTRLTESERLSGRIRPDQEYRLPTEAEWEYACRAGSATPYCFGEDPAMLDDYCWHGGGWSNEKNVPIPGGNTRNAMHPQPVRLKKPNAWGLHDMHGNAMEWCEDAFAGYPTATAIDPIVLRAGSSRVTRGGSWTQIPELVTSSFRLAFPESIRGAGMGLRLVLSLPEESPAVPPIPARSDSTAAPPAALAPAAGFHLAGRILR